MFGLGMHELIIVGIVAILLFGKRLPEVARTMGHTYREFRKQLSDFQTQLNVHDTPTTYSSASYSSPTSQRKKVDEGDDYEELRAPKLAPPPPAEPADKDGAVSRVIPEK